MGNKSGLLLILEPGKNRDRLMEWLGQDFEITVAGTVGFEFPNFDLAILDRPGLDRFGELLGARKESEAPVLLPLLLLASSREINLLAHHLQRTVDEIILAPLQKPELLVRIANLLKLRRLSIELQSTREPRQLQREPSQKAKRLDLATEAIQANNLAGGFIEVHEAARVPRTSATRQEAGEAGAGTEAQLPQEQKLETLGSYAGGIAHEFNNVLGTIKGYIELAIITLEGNAEAEKVRSKLQAALRAGDRALGLVQQIRAFNHSSERDPRAVEILPIIKEDLKLLRASIPHTIEIRQQLEAKCGLVLADPAQISQIFKNLSNNACQAMGDRGGVLEVVLEPIRLDAGLAEADLDLPEGVYVRLTVSDTGQGFDPKTLRRILDPSCPTKTVGQGTGPGLSAIQGIVKNLSGGVKATSKLGQGSTFQIYLPRYQGNPRKAPATEPVPRGVEHILLVDDEPRIVQISREYLERLGYRVTARGSSLEAWEEFRKQPESFDLIVTDLTMPVMSGVDLAAAMLQLRPEFPVILTTGHDGAKIVEQAKAMGLRYCLMKPLVLRHLGLVVRRALDAKLTPAESQPAVPAPRIGDPAAAPKD